MKSAIGDLFFAVCRPLFHVKDYMCWLGYLQGYLWKKSQLRRNWRERWFTLRPSNLSYYTGEDRKDCQGNIALDGNCYVEV